MKYLNKLWIEIVGLGFGLLCIIQALKAGKSDEALAWFVACMWCFNCLLANYKTIKIEEILHDKNSEE